MCGPPRRHPLRRDGESGDGCARVGPHRVRRLRRPADAHHVAPRALRRALPLARARRVRGRRRLVQPATGAGVDAALDPLRVARAGCLRCARRRPLLHRPRARADPRPGGAVPGRQPADVGARCRRRRRGCGCCCCGACGRGARADELEACAPPSALARLRRGGRRRVGVSRSVRRVGADRVRDRRAPHPAALG